MENKRRYQDNHRSWAGHHGQGVQGRHQQQQNFPVSYQQPRQNQAENLLQEW